MKKKLLVLFISMFAFVSGASALSLDKGSQYNKSEDADNIVRLPVKYQADSSEVVTQVTLKCSVWDDPELKAGSSLGCSFEGGEDNKYTSSTANLDPSKEYSVDLIVTNPTTTKKSVYVKVEATWLGSSASQGPKTFVQSVSDVKAKKAEVVASNNAQLSNVKFSKGKMSPSFSKDVQSYTVYDIADTINKITYEATCADKGCNTSAAGGTSVSNNSITLAKGENEIVITSISEDGQAQVKYTFKVYRGETSFNSAKLKYIEVKDAKLEPAFTKDITTYALTVPTDVTSLKEILSYEAIDSNAKVEVEGADGLKEGKNEVKISVTNVTEEETITYTLNVTLEDTKAIKVTSYKDKKVGFTIEGGDEAVMAEEEFEKKYPEEYAKIKNGTYVFDKDGNRTEKQVEVKEKSVDDDDDDKPKKKSSKVVIIIVLIVLGVAVIGVSAYFIFFKKPKDEDDDNKKDKKNKKDDKKASKEEKVEDDEEVKEEETKDEEEEKSTELDEDAPEEEDEDIKFKRTKNRTVDIDEALSDLMNTKEYDFKTKTSIKKDDE